MADVSDSLAVTAGRPNSVVVPLRQDRDDHRRGAKARHGPARTRGRDAPLAGGEGLVRTAKTDARGRYTFSSLPGKWHVSPFKLPPALIRAPGQPWKEITVSEGQGRLELEPWEAIPAAPPLRFIVRDENGRPAAHAGITGQSGSHYMPETTDDGGEFAVPGLPPGSEVSIEVRLGERMTDGPVKAFAGTPQPVVVTIVPGLATALAGRVVGPGGTPIAEAGVRLEFRDKVTAERGFAFPQTLSLGDRAEVQTGTDGTFRTPKHVYRKNREFRVEVTAAGFSDGKTDWVSADAGDLITFPDLVLRPHPMQRLIAGRVVDRGGDGVAAVTVFQPTDSPRTEAITDDAGRFRLDGVPSGSRAGVRREGRLPVWRSGRGTRRCARGDPVARADEPPISIRKPVPPPLSRAEERSISLELIAPLVAPARAGSLGQMGQAVVPALGRVDPDRVLEMLENRVLPQATNGAHQVVLGQLEEDPTAAVATIEADRDPAARAQGLLALADALTDDQGKRRLELVDRSLAEARRVEDKESRLRLLRQVADRWLELGLVDRATDLRQGARSSRRSPETSTPSPPRTSPKCFGRDRSPPGEPIFERTDAMMSARPTRERCSATTARPQSASPRSIRRKPSRLVPQVVPNFWDEARDHYVLQTAGGGPTCPARKILEGLNAPSGPDSRPRPELVAEGLALLAADRVEIDPAGARKLLDEAFERMRKVASEEHRVNDPSVSNRMARLLPLIERIDPDRLEEQLWLAAAYRPPLFEHGY